jgi:SAM-dependent methyltransferase
MNRAVKQGAWASADPVPPWAGDAFPGGLERHSPHIWAAPSFDWTLAEQSRLAAAALTSPEGGSGPAATRHIEHLLGAVADLLDLRAAPAPLVLSLNSRDCDKSVIPWLNLLPQSRVLAADPAGMLLANVVRRTAEAGADERVMCVMAHPDEDVVAPGSVDIVSGVGYLHKLQDPDRAIAAAARALRPGGHAIFLEPFDGFAVLRLAYERICVEARLRDDPLAPAVREALEGFAADIAARTLPDPAGADFGKLESKWLFGREALATAAANLGFSSSHFLAHNDHETLYRDIALLQIRAAAGVVGTVLPTWAIDVLDSFDRALRPPTKRLLMLEGTIVLTR